MVDTSQLEVLDPYDLMDAECERLRTWFATLDDRGWAAPSACEGWSRRDLLAHLVAVEEYFSACLTWGVAELMRRYAASGAGSLDELNAAGVAAAEDAAGPELLAAWSDRNAGNRSAFRAADGEDIDTSVGAYPCRLQAFHAAFEYAIHADDVDAPVEPNERDARQDWLAAVARFALTEVHEETTVEAGDGRYSVSRDGRTVSMDRDDFIGGVSGRSVPGRLDTAAAALLDLGY